jgi:hypothetical protein
MGRINHDRKSRLAAFDRLIGSVHACCRVNPDVEARMEKIKILLEALVNGPDTRACGAHRLIATDFSSQFQFLAFAAIPENILVCR